MKYKYKVCTECFTYNHGPYIKEALDGFAMQKTNFPVVSVIIDDASTDNTAAVIKRYMEDNFLFNETDSYIKDSDYGEIMYAKNKNNSNCYFAVIFLKENHYSINKSRDAYIAEWVDNSEYIAFCEGDDYWTVPDKIQIQVEAMEQHPEVDISAHAFKRVHAITGELVDERHLSLNDSIFSIEQVIMGEGGYVGTPTLMLRRSVFNLKEKYLFWKEMDYDYTVQLAGSLRGGLLFLKECMVDKRTRVPGSFTNKDRIANKNEKTAYNHRKIKMLKQFDKETEKKYHPVVYARILLNNIRSYNTAKENRQYLYEFREGLSVLSFNQKFGLYILSYMGGLVSLYRRLRYGK